MYEQRISAVGRLARAGFTDAAGAALLIESAKLPDALVDAVAVGADPDLGIRTVARLLEVLPGPDPAARLAADPQLSARLAAVLGASTALGDRLVRHPEIIEVFAAGRQELLAGEIAGEPATASELRIAYYRALAGIAAVDLTGEAGYAEVTGAIADLAASTVRAALRLACAADPQAAASCRLAVIGMGKCGGRELNYVSDVDVVFVAEPADGADEADALAAATRLAAAVIRICGEPTADGVIWQLDAALRPEGKAGALVRTLASFEAYYQRWAGTWEFQALLKARPIAGDGPLGTLYMERIASQAWQAAGRDHFVDDVQAMRRRVTSLLADDQADRELKLGRGGLRDVEFAVQLLQLVHGRIDPRVRVAGTVPALQALCDGGYVGRSDAAELIGAYEFLRRIEHRIQLRRLQRTHLLPGSAAELRIIGRAMGYGGGGEDPADRLDTEWNRTRRVVERLHEKLFYRPLVAAVARLDPGEQRLSPEAARERLEALGFADPAGALRHIDALTSGVSRRAAIQRTLLPVLLGWFADAPNPDAGLLAFRRVSEELGTTPWYLRFLRDEGQAAERLARLLATSAYIVDLLLRAPEALRLLARDEDLVPALDPAALRAEMRAAGGRLDFGLGAAIGAIRSIRRRELFRIAAADLLGLIGTDQVGRAISAVTEATIDAALAAIGADRRSAGEPVVGFAVIAMGRLGGQEQGYGSDADVVFVHDPGDLDERVATEAAIATAGALRTQLAAPSTDPPLAIDADLRPEGRGGALSRTLAGYAEYYRRWSLTWESQALLRARPIAGDVALGERFVALIDPHRWPAHGLDEHEIREVRRIKARVESERLPRGADPALHTKLGRGALADVEWTVQLIQLRFGAEHPPLRTTSTIDALRAAAAAGLLTAADARILEDAWRCATRARNAMMLVRDRSSDQLPSDPRELAPLAAAAGCGSGQELLEEYLRATRRARAVVEKVFYED